MTFLDGDEIAELHVLPDPSASAEPRDDASLPLAVHVGVQGSDLADLEITRVSRR